MSIEEACNQKKCVICGRTTRVKARNRFYTTENPTVCVKHARYVWRLGIAGAKKWYDRMCAIYKEEGIRELP